MRYHFFLHYGWFLQNFEKDFIPTLLHTTVDIGLLHSSGLLRHEISQEKGERPKKSFEGHFKDQIAKK